MRRLQPLITRPIRRPAGHRQVASLCVCAVLAACSPPHDWREVRLGPQGLVALLPCRPQHDERFVPLAGTTVTMRLAACTAEGRTWAAAEIELPPALDAATAMQALHDAARRNIGLDGSISASATHPPVSASEIGPAGGRWQWAGRRPDGQPTQMHLGLSTRGRSILQLSMIGATAAPAEALDSFFTSSRWVR